MLETISSYAVHKMFPAAPLANVSRYWPDVQAAFIEVGLPRVLALAALATIAAECAPFAPLVEQQSKFNTSPGGKPFDLYDRRGDLGNQGPPDGERFRGRGYVQLTGRYNYYRYGPTVTIDLIKTPDAAAYSVVAARILARFILDESHKILSFAAGGDLAGIRRVVNGGSHGLDMFSKAWILGLTVLPRW